MKLTSFDIVTSKSGIGIVLNGKVFFRPLGSSKCKSIYNDTYVYLYHDNLTHSRDSDLNINCVYRISNTLTPYGDIHALNSFYFGDCSTMQVVWQRNNQQIKVYNKEGAEIGYVKKEDIT